MTKIELEHELRVKYARHKKNLSDPFELLDLVVDARELCEKEKEQAIELAEEVYFQIGVEHEPHR